jgi:hypothetical protein
MSGHGNGERPMQNARRCLARHATRRWQRHVDVWSAVGRGVLERRRKMAAEMRRIRREMPFSCYTSGNTTSCN